MSELPDTWAMTTLGELVTEVRNGISAKPSSDDGLPILRISAVRPLKLDISDVRYLPLDFADGPTYQLAPDDLLFTRYNGNRDLVGACARVGQLSHALVYPDKLIRVRLDRTAALPRYIEKAANSRTARTYLDQKLKTSAGQIGVSGTDIKGMPLPLPPLLEQQRIADQLDTLLARVNACNDHLDAIPGILKRFRQAVLTTALAESWTDVDHPAPRTAKLSQIAAVGTGSTPLRSTGSFYADSGTPWVTSAATGKPFVTEADQFVTKAAIAAHRLKTYPKGTLLVAMYGEGKTRGQVSELAIEATINQACAAICVDDAKASRKFVKLVLTANYLAMRELAEGGNQPNLNLTKIKEFDIPLPSLDAQEATVRRAEALLAVAHRIEARYKAARAHAQRLAPQVLAKAFRGELVEQDPQDEPASVLLQRLATSQPAKASAPRGRPRAQPKPQPSTSDQPTTDWTSLLDGAWAAPADPDGHAVAVWLTAVLRAWGAPVPERVARLATLLCQQPHLFTPVLPAAQVRLWSRLVGDAAKPLPAQVSRLQPASNHPWGRALQGMRMRGDLVEAGSGDDVTWALGTGAAAIATAGWPDGRAGFVVAHLRAHGLASILPALAPAEQAFVDARAA